MRLAIVRGGRKATLLLLLVGLLFPTTASAGNAELDEVRRRATTAAAQVTEARGRAEEATLAVTDAMAALDQLEADIARLEGQADETRLAMSRLRGSVEETAVRMFTNADRLDVPVVLDEGDSVIRKVRANSLTRYVTLGINDDINAYSALREDLNDASDELEVRKSEQQSLLSQLQTKNESMQAELATVEAAEAELQALLSKLEAEERARIEAERRRQEEAERRRREAARPPARRGGSTSPVGGGGPAPVVGGILCPIAGATSFTDTWGASRSGGRSHQGVDMFAAKGTPIQAVIGGSVRHSQSSLGGLQFYLYGDDGNTYFGSHLDSSGASGRVSAGTIIGTVGSTGNAQGRSPHLHFEVHPGGGRAVNPTPTVRAAC